MVEEVLERPPAVNEFKRAGPTSDERTWAAVAHASTLVTILGTFASGGLGAFILPFVPLAIYVMYRDKSRYVAEQALQAFAAQILATVGLIAAVIVGAALIVAAWVITALLSVILIGLLLIPVALLITLAVVFAWLLWPFVMAGLSIAGTIDAANGKDHRMPFIGQRIVDWIKPRQV